MTQNPTENPTRNCDTCGISDTDPRHVIGLADGGTQVKHLDCCRTDGCPDKTCDLVTSGAEELRGDELREHLETRSD